jgi:hypothetical protein
MSQVTCSAITESKSTAAEFVSPGTTGESGHWQVDISISSEDDDAAGGAASAEDPLSEYHGFVVLISPTHYDDPPS